MNDTRPDATTASGTRDRDAERSRRKPDRMIAPPSGTVTLLFTDIEGSTRLWEGRPDSMQSALQRHDEILYEAVRDEGGYVFKTMGDAFFAAFDTCKAGLAAAVGAQRAVIAESWPDEVSMKLRMALHVGSVELRGDDYFGPPMNRCARMLSAAHGGQVVVSHALREMVRDELPDGVQLEDLGAHRMRDLQRREKVYQATHPELPASFAPLRTLDTVPNNLPAQLTSFVGRERESAAILAALEATRLLTLTGSMGVGKTRLALHVCAGLLDRYPDGVWFVQLEPVAEASNVGFTVAQVLGLSEEHGRSIEQTIQGHLHDRQALLILDNCEHVVEAAADLAAGIVQACPKVFVMSTSREALGVAGESLLHIPPLVVEAPDGDVGESVDRLVPFDAVQLFIDRAVATQDRFTINNENAAAVAQICYRLDGIPLAIELAAARVKVLSPQGILQRLDDRFRLLTSRQRSGPRHHQTLEAAIDWSYDLLSEEERSVFRRLAVFAGGWTLEAAEAVCADQDIEAWGVLDLLGQLLSKSLVTMEGEGEDVRYHMLTTVRRYALDRLASSDEHDAVRARHLSWCLALAEDAVPQLDGSEQVEWLERLALEQSEFAAAFEWAASDSGSVEQGLRLAALLGAFWRMRGIFSPGRAWLDQLLSLPAAQALTADRALALRSEGILTMLQGDLEDARQLLEESLAISRALKDEEALAQTLRDLGNVADEQGEYETATRRYQESLEINRRLGNRWGEAAVLNNLGLVHMRQGELDAAVEHFERCLVIFRDEQAHWALCIVLSNLGEIAIDRDDLVAARTWNEESLAIAKLVGDRSGTAYAQTALGVVATREGRFEEAAALHHKSLATLIEINDRRGLAEWLEGHATLALAEGDHDRATRLLAAAEALREAIHLPRPPKDQSAIEEHLEVLREGLADDFDAVFDAARGEGWEPVVNEEHAGALRSGLA